ARYIVQKSLDQKYRSFEEIIDDLNRVIQHQNINKLTINSTTARELGLQNLKGLSEQSKELTKILNEELKDLTDKQILKPDFYTETKNKVLKFENISKSEVSESFLILLSMWKQHIMYLNNEENRYLTELKERAMYHFFHEKVEDSTLTT
ncbi:MAG: hypothetical protein K2H85_06605, partial [Allobaculum sp.]|nr:hypothetical protein [Allobaculum sp.]